LPEAERLDGRRLYLCTADRPDLAEFVAACIEGGVDVVQLRDKELDARSLLRRAEVARSVCAASGVPFVLNDRPDLALECGADGVHVGQDDAPQPSSASPRTLPANGTPRPGSQWTTSRPGR
jgi:thiamine-phosphate pyrophosphorylase